VIQPETWGNKNGFINYMITIYIGLTEGGNAKNLQVRLLFRVFEKFDSDHMKV